jgi:hypothetical protein
MSASVVGARLARVCWLALAVVGVLACWSAGALAQGWQIVSSSNTTVAAGAELTYYVDVVNRSLGNSDGSPYTITVRLPDGMQGVSFQDNNMIFGGPPAIDCGSVAGLRELTCTSTQTTSPDLIGEVRITVAVDPAASGVLTTSFDISGGGLDPDSTVDPVRVAAAPLPFGIDAFDGRVSDAGGQPYTQAAGHPFDLATDLDLNTARDSSVTSSPFGPIIGDIQPVEPVKDIIVDLPPGLVGKPTGIAPCSTSELSNAQGITALPLCSPTSQVGTATFVQNGMKLGNVLGPVPIFNMAPPPGVPARFGMNAAGTVIVLDASVRTGSDYGLTVTSRNAPAALAIAGVHIDFWGVPSDRSHDSERSCKGQQAAGLPDGPFCASGDPRAAFFRNPTSCTPPGVGLVTTVRASSWMHPNDFKQASFVSHLDPGYPFDPNDPSTPWGAPAGPDHCDLVPFDPVLDAQPIAGSKAGGPAAFAFDVTIPQTDDPDTVGQSDLKKAVVTLPQGVRVNPSSADGLGVCDPA